ncbi:MAG: hypothetical protein M3O02_11220 [Acidobacteriota bacterium]|nr:hypothetical protein [Acidobacteriota bacterium]
MGRPRKPTAVLEATGAFQKDPRRAEARANEPKANGPIGDPPAYFDNVHRAIWFELIDECPSGVLAKSDRKHLELASRLTAKMRIVPGRMQGWLWALGNCMVQMGVNKQEVEDMKDDLRAALGCTSQELSLLATTLTRMGMTPADRSRVHGDPDKPKDDDPFAALGSLLGPGVTGKPVQ